MHSGSNKGDDHPGEDVSDELLIDRYNRGETKALNDLVERYRRPLYSFLWRMTGSGSESDEIFQNTWLRVINKAHGFRQERFKGWVFKIAHNLVIDWSRRQRKQVSLDAVCGSSEGDQTLGDRLADDGPRPDSQANSEDIRKAIELALAQLPDDQREVFVLRMNADVPFKEIAEIQGVSLNTALARMQYALSKMRKLLKDYQPGGERDL